MDMSLSKPRERAKDREAWNDADHGVETLDTTEWLNKCQYMFRLYYLLTLQCCALYLRF